MDDCFNSNVTWFLLSIIDYQRLGLGTILNDDPIPTISIANTTATEGDDNVTLANAVFTLVLSNPR